MNSTELEFELEHKRFYVRIDADHALELLVDNCVRKRDATDSSVAYVWTNIELNWEEHRYVEARYSRATQNLHVTVNRETVFNEQISA